MDKLKVADLQYQLALRKADIRGTKAVLSARLKDALEAEGVSVDDFLLSLKHTQGAVAGIPADIDPKADSNCSTASNDGNERNSQIAKSNSNISSVSAVESIKAEHAKECARAAGLKAKAEFSRKKHELLQREMQAKLQLDFECEQLELQGEIAEADARKEILAEKQREMSMDANIGHHVTVPDCLPKGAFSQLDENRFPCSFKDPCTSSTGPLMSSHASNAAHNHEGRHNHRPVEYERGMQGNGHNSHDVTVSLSQALLEQSRRNLLPKSEIITFDGDITKFRSFIRAFDTRIGNMITNDEERLHYLEQLTSGKPRDLVSSCLLMEPSEGYNEARRLLESRYGNAISAAAAYVEKIRKWPQVKGDDTEALDRFSIFLNACRNAMLGLPMSAREIEHPRVMREILEKLSYSLQERWRRIADNIIRQGRPVMFADLADFVADEARIAANPLFGKQLFGTQNKKEASFHPGSVPIQWSGNRERENTRGLNFHSQAVRVRPENENTSDCGYCGRRHNVKVCQSLKKATPDERWRFVLAKRLCFGCLSDDHQVRDCKKNEEVSTGDSSAGESSSNTKKSSVNVTAALSGMPNTGMPIVPIKIRYKNGPWMETYAFLDSGSSASFCSSSLLYSLGIDEAPQVELSLTTLAAANEVMKALLVSNLEISDLDENNRICLPPVYTLGAIPVSIDDIPTQADVDSWDHLKEVIIPSIQGDVSLLIGVNVPTATEPLSVIPSQNGGPFAVQTRIGWVLNGPVRFRKNAETKATAHRIQLEQFKMNHQNELEGLSSDELGMSVEDRKWMKMVEETCQQKGTQYEVGLPLKTSISLPDSRVVALRRLHALKRKFTNNEYANEYKDAIESMISNGYAEPAPLHGQSNQEMRVWYIPHHGVRHPQKGKLRVVFDCAAKYRGVSLNGELLQGPNLTNNLIDVLIRFRENEVAFMADIESMFHRVSVPETDRDLLRFVWWPGGDTTSQPMDFRMTVHLFGARSSPSVANYALQRTAQDYGTNYPSEVADTIKHNFYVDDVLKSTSDEDSAIYLIRDLTAILAEGGFRLTKFVSNRRKVLEAVPKEDLASQLKELNLDFETLPEEHALGVFWCVETDSIGIRVQLSESSIITRRKMLSTISAMYDPLGIAAPVILLGRQILQELCRRQIGWDERVPLDIRTSWLRWVEGVQLLSSVRLNRCFRAPGFGATSRVELHHFSDASSRGFGTVSFLRLENALGEVHCVFVLSKSRLAPIKSLSIPRLELSAATLAVKVNSMLRRALHLVIHEVFFWSDSTTVLRYIRNETTRFHVFVANRLAIIHDGSSPTQWRYVSSDENPADEASRGQEARLFVTNRRWLMGPSFLYLPAKQWPSDPSKNLPVPVDDPEVRREAVVAAVVAREDPIDRLLYHYSTWLKLRRAVAWLLRVKRHLVALSAMKRVVAAVAIDSRTTENPVLSLADLEEAEMAIVRFVQGCAFPEEMKDLQNQKALKVASPLLKLDPALVDGVLRVGGRLKNCPISSSRMHPIILPKSHPIVTLIIKDVHERVGHGGREHVLAELRESYWILRGNAAVRKVLGNCISCRRRQGPLMKQKMANLPSDRVTPELPPFTHAGVDFFGPFFVKRGRGQLKKYGVIFTCMSSRATHLEVAESLSTDSFICALIRFVSRRGQVKTIRSDRGTNFIGASRELKREMENLVQTNGNIHEAMLKRQVSWKFNPPHASEFGGVWEREIRTVRKVFEALLVQQTITDETLQTLFCEVEAIMNSRPLTYVSPDHRDPKPLAPNDLLLLANMAPVPIYVTRGEDLYARKRWRQASYLADVFWHRWKKEYISLLQQRQVRMRQSKNLKVDDVVLVADDSVPRAQWPLGRVVEVRTSDDGLVRSASLVSKGKTFTRPVSKLVLLMDFPASESP